MSAILAIITTLAVSFNHLSFLDGLSSGSVTDICFDECGIIWIGTGNGLCSYDGNKVLNHPVQRNSIMRLECDGKGMLYVASRGELFSIRLSDLACRHISDDDSRAIIWHNEALYLGSGPLLKEYVPKENGYESRTVTKLKDNELITAICLSSQGNIILGTDGGAVVLLDNEYKEIRRLLLGSMVENLFVDSDGNIWCATFASGLAKIDTAGALSFYRHDNNVSGSLSSDFVRSVCEDDLGDLWIGTFAGLDHFDRASEIFTHNIHDKSRPESISNTSVWVVRKDHQGSIWAGTFFGGVNWFNPSFDIWNKFPDSETEGYGISSPLVSSISRDGDGNILVATEGGGFNSVDPETFNSRTYSSGGREPISGNNVKDIMFDRRYNCIWLGTHLGGIDKIDLRRGHVSHITPRPAKLAGQMNDILSLEDGNDSIYIGSTSGLFVMNKTSETCRKIFSATTSVNGLAGIRDIKTDRRGHLWFTSGGLFRYDPVNCDTLAFPRWANAHAFCIGNDGAPILCIDHDLVFLDYNGNELSRISVESLLFEEVVSALAQSPHSGRFILSTNKGLCILNMDGTLFSRFKSGEGYPIYCPNPKALYVCEDGTVYVGGFTGMVSFNEDNAYQKRLPYNLCFSKLYLDGKESERLCYSKSVTINSGVSSFAIEFFNSNRIPSNTSSFEYKMDGLGKTWTKVLEGNKIFFSGIPYGKYTLHVRASDTDETICREISIPVIVAAPWYLSTIARIVYLLIICLGLFLTIRKLIAVIRKREAEKLALIKNKDKDNFKIFEKATSIVYGNLENPNFGINEFAAEMALSRSSLFDKMKSATGLTPNQFILSTRLKEGARLLKHNPELSIGEIAFKLGFSSPHYFSKCFKDKYGETPALWRLQKSSKI